MFVFGLALGYGILEFVKLWEGDQLYDNAPVAMSCVEEPSQMVSIPWTFTDGNIFTEIAIESVITHPLLSVIST